MYLVTAVLLFAIFVVNVVLGALSGSPFLGDIGEMLMLFAASIAFVVAVLRREEAAKSSE